MWHCICFVFGECRHSIASEGTGYVYVFMFAKLKLIRWFWRIACVFLYVFLECTLVLLCDVQSVCALQGTGVAPRVSR